MTKLIELEKYLIEVNESSDRKVIVVYDKVLARPMPPIVLEQRHARALAEALVGKAEKD